MNTGKVRLIATSVVAVALIFGVTFAEFTKTSAQPLSAYLSVPRARITMYGVGWGSNSVRVQLETPQLNAPAFPGSPTCVNPDGYMTDASDPGNTGYQSALHAAFLSGRSVELIIVGCTQNRPRIVGVNVFR